jgi:hypothetical protein
MTTRRNIIKGFFAGLALAVTPAWARGVPTIHGDGVHDDWEGLQAFLDGKPFNAVAKGSIVRHPGIAGGHFIEGTTHYVSKTLTMHGHDGTVMFNVKFLLAEGAFIRLEKCRNCVFYGGGVEFMDSRNRTFLSAREGLSTIVAYS